MRRPLAQRTLVTVTGDVLVEARNSQYSKSVSDRAGGGAISVSALRSNATTLGEVSALLGAATTLTSRSLTVRSEVVGAPALASTQISTGGAVNVSAPSATATSKPTAKAGIGANAIITALAVGGVGGNVTVETIGRAEADATSGAYGGGLAQVGASNAKAYVDDARRADRHRRHRHRRRRVDPRRTHPAPLTAPPSGRSSRSTPATPGPRATRSIAFPLQTGDVVSYTTSGGSIGGLQACVGASDTAPGVTVLTPATDTTPATIAFERSRSAVSTR